MIEDKSGFELTCLFVSGEKLFDMLDSSDIVKELFRTHTMGIIINFSTIKEEVAVR